MLLVSFLLLIAGGLSYLWQLTFADRVALFTLESSVAALVLALIAVQIASAAYRLAAGRPSLHLELRFPFSAVNAPIFEIAPDGDPSELLVPLAHFKQTRATVVLVNAAGWSARNPAVRISFHGFINIADQEGWAVVDFKSSVGPVSLQWDGGADYLVHGGWSRRLPDIDLQSVRISRGLHHRFLVELVADGYTAEPCVIPVRFKTANGAALDLSTPSFGPRA
jgi:hypothetical protein